MDETELELAILNNMRIEVDVIEDSQWGMDGKSESYKRIKVTLYYNDTAISESEASL